ncbi:unnamed protein product [Rhizophagus irregularis]|jgi:hypothetical protein|nr:unnamed protein product [Rhizophagus irregularis]
MPKINQLQAPDVSEFRLPFPPAITAREIMSDKRKGKKASRPPNAFMIYRKVFSRELAKNYRFQQMRISSLCGSSWKNEPAEVKEYYHRLAHEADKIFLQDLQNDSKLPPPPSLQLFSPSQLPSSLLFPPSQPFPSSEPFSFSSSQTFPLSQTFSSSQTFPLSQTFISSQSFPESLQSLQSENVDDYLKYFDDLERMQEPQNYNNEDFVPIQSFIPNTYDFFDMNIQQSYYPIYELIDETLPEEYYLYFQ